jgi:hypothetical protein
LVASATLAQLQAKSLQKAGFSGQADGWDVGARWITRRSEAILGGLRFAERLASRP